jgi:hypothetical protein
MHQVGFSLRDYIILTVFLVCLTLKMETRQNATSQNTITFGHTAMRTTNVVHKGAIKKYIKVRLKSNVS